MVRKMRSVTARSLGVISCSMRHQIASATRYPLNSRTMLRGHGLSAGCSCGSRYETPVIGPSGYASGRSGATVPR
eukprot:3899731-Rhodomonas_salina.1